jgi:hypothetical protein
MDGNMAVSRFYNSKNLPMAMKLPINPKNGPKKRIKTRYS